MKKLFIILLALVLPGTTHIMAQTKLAQIDDYFSALIKNDQFNGGVLVAENGTIIYERSFGYADFEKKILNKSNTIFPIASISKTIIATAILQLVQAGKLKVDSPVKTYLNWFPYHDITARHLLSHTSGLPPYNAFFDTLRKQQPDRIFTNADFKDGMLHNPKPLIYKPGERGNYDNVNFIILALLIEQLSGQPFSNYITFNILAPANMNDTRIVPFRAQYRDSLSKPLVRPYLFPHRYSDSVVYAGKVPYIVGYWSAYNFSGFGDIVSSTRDLLKYDKAYYSGKLLADSLLQQAFTPVKLSNGKNNAANFGLGWQVWNDSSLGKIVYHNGNATGLSCIILRNISRRQTVIVFDNIHSNNSEPLGFAVIKMLNGISVPQPRKSIAAVYARVLLKQGATKARDTVLQLKNDTLRYYLSEDEINVLGYDFMGGVNNPNPYRFAEERKYQQALETFKLNTELFPDSWNVYDSYGEILLLLGRKDEAIKMYEKSVQLNPKNEGGKKILEQLKN